VPMQCAIGVILCLLVAAAGTALSLNLSTSSLLYLLLVVSFAVHCGFFQASVISAAAIACMTYFFAPPAFTFYISDPRNAVAIVIFEVAALLVSRLSSRERTYAEESRNQRVKLQRLFAVSRGALTLDLGDAPEAKMAELLETQFELLGVAIYNSCSSKVGAAGIWKGAEVELHRRLKIGLISAQEPFQGAVSADLHTTAGSFGMLVVLGEIRPIALETLASLVALTLERHRAFVQQGEAEASRRSEQLRTTVLDGLAHAFKTPLTVIRAASSGLLEIGKLDPLQSELTSMIDEQSEWLDDLANRVLLTARAGEHDICLELESVDIASLFHEIVADSQRDWASGVKRGVPASPIRISVPVEAFPISVDHDLLRVTLAELLANAIKYSHDERPITLAAESSGDDLLLSVHSWSNVIDLSERERIFDRFYRCREHRDTAPGTGIGLSVARRTAEAHKGQIWVTSDEQEGTTFHISLPMQTAASALPEEL